MLDLVRGTMRNVVASLSEQRVAAVLEVDNKAIDRRHAGALVSAHPP